MKTKESYYCPQCYEGTVITNIKGHPGNWIVLHVRDNRVQGEGLIAVPFQEEEEEYTSDGSVIHLKLEGNPFDIKCTIVKKVPVIVRPVYSYTLLIGNMDRTYYIAKEKIGRKKDRENIYPFCPIYYLKEAKEIWGGEDEFIFECNKRTHKKLYKWNSTEKDMGWEKINEN